jgi:ribose transport system ATP-binding protein
MRAVLRAAGVSKAFGPNQVLHDVTFALQRGTIHALVGENGAGKSTLMNILSGVFRPDSGAVMLDDTAVVFENPRHAMARGIRTVHQELSLFPNRSVAANIFGRHQPSNRWGFVRRREMRERAASALARIGSAIDPDALVGELSIGEQQMVEIARALAEEARVLILDEPTSALSEPDAERLFTVLRDLRSSGAAIIYISHKLTEVMRLSDEVTVLRDGRVVGTSPAESVNQDQLVRLMVGRDVAATRPDRTAADASDILVVEGLSRGRTFREVSFSVRSGEILGFAGLVGSGRTEVCRAIFGADRFDRGRVLVNGESVSIRCPRDAIRLGIGYLTEDRKAQGLFLAMSVGANIVAASQPRVATRLAFLRSAVTRATANAWLRRLDIRPQDDRYLAGRLSGGNQQKVLLAKWLAAEPRVLIVDEPTRGVDVGAKAAIHAQLQALAARGLAIVLVSSELPEVMSLSHRIAVFRGGCLVAMLDGRTASADEVMTHAAA